MGELANIDRSPFLTRHEMAAMLRVSVRTLDSFVGEGCPSITWGLRRRVFEPAKVLAWAQQRQRRERAA